MESDPNREALARAAAAPLVGAMAPIGCMMGLISVLFWLTMIGLVIFCAWIFTLPAPPPH